MELRTFTSPQSSTKVFFTGRLPGLLFLLLLLCFFQPATSQEMLWISGPGTAAISLVDMNSQSVCKTIPISNTLGQGWYVFSEDRDRAYFVMSRQTYLQAIGAIDLRTMTEIDLDNDPCNGITRIPLGSDGSANYDLSLDIAITLDGNYAYVTDFGRASNRIFLVDLQNNVKLMNITAGGRPAHLDITPDGDFVYVTNHNSRNVSVISTSSNSKLMDIGLGDYIVRGIAINAAGTHAYVCSQNRVSAIDLNTNFVTGYATAGGAAFSGVAVTSDGSTVYASSINHRKIYVYDTTVPGVPLTLIDQIMIPAGYLSISADDSKLIIGAYPYGITIYDLVNATTLTTMFPPSQAFGLAPVHCPPAPLLVGHWTFEAGDELVDLTGSFADLALHSGAQVTNGKLEIDAGQYALTTNYKGPTIADKTLVAWLSLDDLDIQSGAALSMKGICAGEMDAIVYGELESHRWMAGSDYFKRTSPPSPGYAETTTGELIQMVITYAETANGTHIIIYRNGQVIGDYVKGPMFDCLTGNAEVAFGIRHTWPDGSTAGELDAHIEEARIYCGVLSQADIQRLTPILPPAQISGKVSHENNPMEGIIVKLVDPATQLPFPAIDDQYTNIAGEYLFENLPDDDYQVEIVLPLGYSTDTNPAPQPSLTLSRGETAVVDFALDEVVLLNNARGKGYWKHQFNVYVRNKGHAQESEQDLINYLNTIESHYNPHFDFFENICAGATNFADWQNILSVKGNSEMATKAKAQLAALTLNIMSLKLGQYQIVSEDNKTAGDALTCVSEWLNDSDPSNDELAKNLADWVNNQQTVPAGLIVPIADILYKETAEEISEIALPGQYALFPNFPNPFNPVTTIEFDLPEATHSSLVIYDLSGRSVITLRNGLLRAGHHTVQWHGVNTNGQPVASGIYLYKLTAGDFLKVRKMALIR